MRGLPLTKSGSEQLSATQGQMVWGSDCDLGASSLRRVPVVTYHLLKDIRFKYCLTEMDDKGGLVDVHMWCLVGLTPRVQ